MFGVILDLVLAASFTRIYAELFLFTRELVLHFWGFRLTRVYVLICLDGDGLYHDDVFRCFLIRFRYGLHPRLYENEKANK